MITDDQLHELIAFAEKLADDARYALLGTSAYSESLREHTKLARERCAAIYARTKGTP